MALSGSPFRLWFSNDLGLKFFREYATSYLNITSVKIQPKKADVFIAANEGGTILMYNLQSDDKSSKPQQFKVLSYEYGGVTDLCWIGPDIFIAGTTRGWLVVFSLKNEKRRMFEVCKAKAHGDGAAQVPVEAIDYCSKTKRLVTVGQGVNSVRLWDITEEGILTACVFAKSPTSYLEPRFVAFCNDNSHIVVGFSDQITVQKISLDTGAILGPLVLGHQAGSPDGRHLGNAILLSDGRLLVYNLKNGLDIFDSATFSNTSSGSIPIRFDVNHTASQGISLLREEKYALSPAQNGDVYIFCTEDSKYAGKITVSGRAKHIQAVHSITDRTGRDLVVISSNTYLDGDRVLGSGSSFSQLNVWVGSPPSNSNSETKRTRAQIKARMEEENHSTFRLVLLCITVYMICQLATTFFTKGLLASDTPFFDQRVPTRAQEVSMDSQAESKDTAAPFPGHGSMQMATPKKDGNGEVEIKDTMPGRNPLKITKALIKL